MKTRNRLKLEIVKFISYFPQFETVQPSTVRGRLRLVSRKNEYAISEKDHRALAMFLTKKQFEQPKLKRKTETTLYRKRTEKWSKKIKIKDHDCWMWVDVWLYVELTAQSIIMYKEAVFYWKPVNQPKS